MYTHTHLYFYSRQSRLLALCLHTILCTRDAHHSLNALCGRHEWRTFLFISQQKQCLVFIFCKYVCMYILLFLYAGVALFMWHLESMSPLSIITLSSTTLLCVFAPMCGTFHSLLMATRILSALLFFLISLEICTKLC